MIMKKEMKIEYIVPVIVSVELTRNRAICQMSGGTLTPITDVEYDDDSD